MKMNAENFLAIIKDQVLKIIKDFIPLVFSLGTISSSYTSGRPQIVFDGESTASTRTYPYLSSYTPAANDRVIIAIVGHGGVILGKII